MEIEHNGLYEQLVRLEWLLRRYQIHNHIAHGPMADPHRGQGRVLALLKLNPEISQKELSNILDIRSQSLGELLSKLEKSGYITRFPSESDRRVMMIRLTPEGAAAVAGEERQGDEQDLFDCLDPKEQETLSGYLDRIMARLQQLCEESGREMSHGHRDFFGGGEEGPDPRRMGMDPRRFGGVPRPPHHTWGPEHGGFGRKTWPSPHAENPGGENGGPKDEE